MNDGPVIIIMWKGMDAVIFIGLIGGINLIIGRPLTFRKVNNTAQSADENV